VADYGAFSLDYALAARSATVKSVVWFATLTGAEDAQADLSLPIASLSATLNREGYSSVSVGTPYLAALAGDIALRPNGYLSVSRALLYVDGTLSASAEMWRLPFTLMRYDRGGHSQSITLQGGGTLPPGNQTRTVERVIRERLIDNGARVWQVLLSDQYRAGDTAIVGAESVTVETVQINLSPRVATVEITEAV
jgi:hypothetical protein